MIQFGEVTPTAMPPVVAQPPPGTLPVHGIFQAQTSEGTLFDAAPVWVWVAGALALGLVFGTWNGRAHAVDDFEEEEYEEEAE